jgi:hypothetical protein
MLWSVPKIDEKAVHDFARRLGCTWIGMVPVQPEIFATELTCHQNVEINVNLVGGEKVLGYYFMDYCEGLDYQAILHSVWRDHCGNLIDITPFEDGRKRNTFAILPQGSYSLKYAFWRSIALYEKQNTILFR